MSKEISREESPTKGTVGENSLLWMLNGICVMGAWNLRPKGAEGEAEKGCHGPKHEVCGLSRSHTEFKQVAKGGWPSGRETRGVQSEGCHSHAHKRLLTSNSGMVGEVFLS